MSEPPVLHRSALDAISELCQRAVVDAPTRDELEAALFAVEQPAFIRGDPAVGVVATVEAEGNAHVRLLAVDPSARGQGHGTRLLKTAEKAARDGGYPSLTIGADSPYFLWPGAPSSETALLCLLEGRHYTRVETNFDMDVDLSAIPDDPGGHVLASVEDHADVDAWAARHWPNWRLELLRALDKGNLVLTRDEGDGGDIAAVCAFEVNRAGFLGPVAARPDLLGRGRGKPALLGALHELRRRGRDRVSVVWVGPVVPYARVGGVVTNTYFVYRKTFR